MPVLSFLFLLSCGIIGALIARGKGINPVVGFLAGFLFNLPGIVLLFILGFLKKKAS